MTNKANIPRAILSNFFGEVSKTATELDSLVIIEVNGVNKMRFKHYAKKIPHWVKFMRTVDKAGTVRTGNNGNVGNHGGIMVFLGYADKHEGNCY
jgi:hypothetical protein